VLAPAAFGTQVTACTEPVCPIASASAAIAVVGVEADIAACGTPSDVTLASGATCIYKATTGYTVTGELSNVCGVGTGTLTTTAVPSVTGCATDYYQSVAGTGAAARCTAW
jgi:hypothetical protein